MGSEISKKIDIWGIYTMSLISNLLTIPHL